MYRLYSRIAFVAAIGSLTVSCSTFYTNIQDPGSAVPVSDIIKSVRCELVSFFTINYQRALVFKQLEREGGILEAIKSYPYMQIDRRRYASVIFNSKEAIKVNFSAGVSIKDASIIPGSPDLKTWRSAPSLGAQRSFERGQPFAIPQYATIGPALAGDTTKQIYDMRSDSFSDYFCYRSIGTPVPRRLEDRLTDLQSLVNHSMPEKENFQRIFISGMTLAEWLGLIGREMSLNSLNPLANSESVLSGQIGYSFGLTIAPGLAADYTLIARQISPFTVGGSVSDELTGTFSIVINLKDVVAAIGAPQGNAKVEGPGASLIPQTPD